jgi:uncharacterized protein (AIM24 family)
MAMEVVDYEIRESEMPFVEVELDPGAAAGLLCALLGAAKRLVAGESLFCVQQRLAVGLKAALSGGEGVVGRQGRRAGHGLAAQPRRPSSRRQRSAAARAPGGGARRRGVGRLGGIFGATSSGQPQRSQLRSSGQIWR